jgi:hypothetical protein
VAVAVLINLALPEFAYRVYNARAATPKTPHGTFFYYHQQTNQTIQRYTKLERDVLGSADGDRRFVLVDWVGYGYLMYGMATSASGVEKLSGQEGPENVFTHEYRCGDILLRLLHVPHLGTDYGKQEIVLRIERAIDEGYRVYLPEESVEGTFANEPFTGLVRLY